MLFSHSEATLQLPPTGLPIVKAHTRGSRAGVRVKGELDRRNNKMFLPSVVVGNIWSLANKTDELSASAKTPVGVKPSLFLRVVAPRKHPGQHSYTWCERRAAGGLHKWHGHVTVNQWLCPLDVEMCIHTCEYSHMYSVTVYIPPRAMSVCDIIYNIAGTQAAHPRTFISIKRDFNHFGHANVKDPFISTAHH